jgi:sodium/proline symporter
MDGLLDLYELLHAFVFSCVVIVVVLRLTVPPSKEIQDEFETAKFM